jgi:ketosteroid isomerase-like protein
MGGQHRLLASGPDSNPNSPTPSTREQDMTDAPSTNTDLIRTVIRAVDNADYDAIAAHTSQDVHFRFGNAPATNTQTELLAAARSFRGAIADLRHTVHDVWEVDDGTVIATMDVYYRRLDGIELTLPCCNVFRVRGSAVCDYLIYMDVNPVLAP